MTFSMRFYTLVALLALLISVTLAQSTTTSASSTAATVYPGTSKWDYVGCQNETTGTNGTNGARALSGTTEAADSMTVDTCLNYCSAGGFPFAGLEYTRECYCSQFLSALSAKLPDSACDLTCEGNSTQICGGSLALTVYKAKSSSQGTGIKIQQNPMSSSVLALGIALAVLLCLA